MKTLSSLKSKDLYNKKVFLRADLDVPLKNKEIADETRLKAWFPTLELLYLKIKHMFLLQGTWEDPKA